MRPSPYSIYTSSRPVRVAFVVPTDASADLLDDLFAANYWAWGGRLRPIVPATNGELDAMYRRLLVGCDPDVVYLYCDLNTEVIAWMDRSIQPWSIVRHRDRPAPPGTRLDYRPVLPLHPVQSTAALKVSSPRYWHQPATHVASQLRVASASRRWYSRNFGEQPPNLMGAPSAGLTIQAEWTPAEILSELSHVGRPIFPAVASAMNVKFFRPRVDDDRPEYCIVVGDTTSDWLMFWNRVFTIDRHQLDAWHTLFVSPEQFANAEFIVALQGFVAQHSVRSGNNPASLCLRSSSVAAAILRQFNDTLRQRRGGRVIDATARVESLQPWSIRELRPTERDSFPILDYATSELRLVEQQAISDRVLLQMPPSDIELTDDWALDLEVEYQAPSPYYAGEHLTWSLPRRAGLPGLFLRSEGRSGRGQSLSFRMRGTNPVSVTSPDDATVLRVAILNPDGGGYPPTDVRAVAANPYTHIGLSDKGGYIDGILALVGGLRAASSLFGNTFWRNCINHACHRSLQQEQVALRPIVDTLRKRQAELRANLEANNYDVLGKIILRAIRAEPLRDVDITAKWFEDQFIKQRRVYLAAHNDYLRGVPADQVAVPEGGRSLEEKAELVHLRRALQHHVDAGVFLKGVRYRCPSCGLGFWRQAPELDARLDCEGCQSPVRLPVEASWTYRLNTLVRNGVGNHGVVPVIWALAQLREQARTMFCHQPGVRLFRQWDDPEPAGELDIACIRDGKLVVAEVKTTAREFSDDTIGRLGQQAIETKADVLVFAVFEANRQIAAVDRCKALFPNHGFSVEGLCLEERALDGTPDPWSSSW